MVDIVEHIRRGVVDRGVSRPGSRVRRRAGMDGAGFEPEIGRIALRIIPVIVRIAHACRAFQVGGPTIASATRPLES